MNKTDLNKIRVEFTDISKRLMEADYSSCIGIMERFLDFIEKTELIKDFIESCGGFSDKMKEDFESVLRGNGRFPFKFSIGKEKEISEIYSIIKILCEREYQYVPKGLLYAYSNADKNNDMMVKNFNRNIVSVLIEHIKNYIKEVDFDMGSDNKTVTYTNNGGQLIVANDKATVHVVQNNGMDNKELKEFKDLIDEMRNSLSNDLSDEDKQNAIESIDTIEQELGSNAPNEKLVTTQFKLLKKIDSSVKFVSACCSIATFANRFYPFFDQIALMFGQI